MGGVGAKSFLFMGNLPFLEKHVFLIITAQQGKENNIILHTAAFLIYNKTKSILLEV